MLAAFLPLQTALLNNMKTQLDEVLIGQVASVLCVTSRMYTSVSRSYQIFTAYRYCLMSHIRMQKLLVFLTYIFTMTIVSGLTKWLKKYSMIRYTKLLLIGHLISNAMRM
jgi:hypothetical protein